MMNKKCFHCGKIINNIIYFDNKKFCCNGCKTVYNIIINSNLDKFYNLNLMPGKIPEKNINNNLSLNNPKIFNKIIDFKNDKTTIVRFFIPSINCTSCIFILENLYKINSNIINSKVFFNEKIIRIVFNNKLKINELVLILTNIGYKPIINSKSLKYKKRKIKRDIIYKLVISFFCFGNVMLLALPEYLNLAKDKWLLDNINFFRWTMILFSIPSIFFCSLDYFKSAYNSIKKYKLNIDIPISLGITILFIRTLYDVIYNIGPGYTDSLTGLIFFLLCGKYFTMKTYDYISFENNYKNFYPISVTVIKNGKEKDIFIDEIKKNDIIIIRNEEIIPADCILIKGQAAIDNSFITGESKIINKDIGEYLYAGGKQKGSLIEIKVVKEMDKSYLLKLWHSKNFINKNFKINTIIDKIASYFTITVLFISLLTGIYWYFFDKTKILSSISSILIIACPCAISLSIPFTLGNIMRICAKHGFYFRNIYIIEKLSKVGFLIFDKTGTITDNEKIEIDFYGKKLSSEDKKNICSLLKNSNHPLSKALYKKINISSNDNVFNFKEIPGKGLEGIVNNNKIKIGSETYIKNYNNKIKSFNTKVFISINNYILGYFLYHNSYRKNIKNFFKKLTNYKLCILSGDNNSEKFFLKSLLPKNVIYFFNKNPYSKLKIIKYFQKKGEIIMMFGDGLNDFGALKKSNIGVFVCNSYNSFSPYCDILMNSNCFEKIPNILKLSKISINLVILNFVISILYNIIGITIAIKGDLNPLISAILMPISSITVILLSTIFTWFFAYKNNI